MTRINDFDIIQHLLSFLQKTTSIEASDPAVYCLSIIIALPECLDQVKDVDIVPENFEFLVNCQ